MAAPEGNDFSSKNNRLWGNTLRRALVQDPKKLRAIADKLVDMAAEGDIQAIKEIGDRLDGKAKQQVEHTGDADNPVAFTEIRRTIVDPSN